MTKKEDLIAEAEGLQIPLDSRETIADLEAKIAAHKAETKPSEGWQKPKAEDMPTTKFRVHYRTSLDANRHKHDCDARDIGHAHELCRKFAADKHGEEVRVFIDKTKVLKAAA